jgi:hypothetical protein
MTCHGIPKIIIQEGEMKKIACISFLTVLGLCSTAATAADKVVVIPMGSSAKGTDGQVQYNDNGTTAGAEVYYDKATGKLELSGELRTVDGAGSNRLWGKGRPGNGLVTHTDPNGYCTTSAGIKHALSSRMDNWGNADNVCPAGTWVCSQADLPTTGSCPIQPLLTFPGVNCDGTIDPPDPEIKTALFGYVADALTETWDPETNPGATYAAIVRYSNDWNMLFGVAACTQTRVWCCWE